MIAIRNTATGEIQFVAALDGIDLTAWEATGAAMPTDLASRAYTSVAGILSAAPQSLACLDFLGLWTPAETRAVMQTSSDMMATAWAMTLASPSMNLGDARVIGGVGLARSLGILTEARAARILSGLAPEPAA